MVVAVLVVMMVHAVARASRVLLQAPPLFGHELGHAPLIVGVCRSGVLPRVDVHVILDCPVSVINPPPSVPSPLSFLFFHCFLAARSISRGGTMQVSIFLLFLGFEQTTGRLVVFMEPLNV